MSTLEQDLTEVMRAYAEGAPDDAGLLSQVHAESRRHRRNRRVAVAVASTVAAAAALALIASPVRLPRAESRFADPTGFLVDSRDLELRFPLTPAYLPPGLDSHPPVLEETGSFGSANYLLGGEGGVQLRVQHSEHPMIEGAVADVVDGKPAQRSCSGDSCLLTWERKPGQYVMVTVTAPGGDARALVRRVADAGLLDQPVVHRPRLVLGLAPARGCVLSDPRPTSTSMNPIGDPGYDGPACPVGAEVFERDAAAAAGHTDGSGEAVHLGGYDGWLTERTYYLGGFPGASPRGLAAPTRALHVQLWVAVLKLDDGRRLVVQTPTASPWSREELDRFVRAIIVPTG